MNNAVLEIGEQVSRGVKTAAQNKDLKEKVKDAVTLARQATVGLGACAGGAVALAVADAILPR